MSMGLQQQFRRFDEAIKLTRLDENQELSEKRERILRRLREGLARMPYGPGRFETFNQGSYAMGTGVRPVNGDYDIDVGLVFDVHPSVDPVALKQQVYSAVEGHTAEVRVRQPCVTVWYQQGGEHKYHVDLAIYRRDSWGRLELAMGKLNSRSSQRSWVPSEPSELVDLVTTRYRGEDQAQFLRVIRLLKHWKNRNFSLEGHAAPRGIALTVLALEDFSPRRTYEGHDDLSALRSVVDGMASKLGGWQRPQLLCPTEPRNDLLKRMTDQQLRELRDRVDTFSRALEMCASSYYASQHIQILQGHLGPEFGR